MLPELLTIDDFCKLTKTGRTRVYSEINSGRLKAIKNGRSTRISIEAMKEWLDALPQYNSECGEA